LLTDPTGSRRYLCAEVKEKIDCTPLEHKQLFAQLKAELEGGERYWFSAEEEAELQLRNREFYAMPVEQEVFYRCFRLPEAERSSNSIRPRSFSPFCRAVILRLCAA